MSAFKHASRNSGKTTNRESHRVELSVLLARLASQQAISPTARATMVTPSSDPLTASGEWSIDRLIVPGSGNPREQAASASFHKGIAEALLTCGKGS